jgi:gamma-glutamyltranspeptidase / glutathione hydrolase
MGGPRVAAHTESGWEFRKQLVTGSHGVVAAKHPLAARAGLEILRRGGNAVDAAVATAFAVGVVEPWASGLGGAGVLVVSSPGATPMVVDFGVQAPAEARADMFELADGYDAETSWWRAVRDEANIHGPRSAAVPGVPAGLAAALAEFGTMPLSEVVRPAAALARDGFPIEWTAVLYISMDAPTLRRYAPAARVYLQDGLPPAISTVTSPNLLRQPELGRTLEVIGSEGVEAFYQGDVARRMSMDVQRGGGVLTEADFARYRPVIEPAQVYRRRAYSVAVAPGPHAGIILAEILDILDGCGFEAHGHNDVEYLHLLIEATHAAFGDRLRLLGDGAGWDVLLEQRSAARHRARIRAGRSTPWQPRGADATSTTHLCVIDRRGTAVSITQTLLSWFGSRVLVPDTGVVLNNGMLWFDPVPGGPNSIAPGRRALSNMAPALALSGDQPVLAVGASGGRRIVDGVLQVLLNAMDVGLDVQQAIAAPRIDASGVHVLVDARIPDETQAALARRGHRLACVGEQVWPRYFSSPVAISRDAATGVLCGGVDPPHAASAAGY